MSIQSSFKRLNTEVDVDKPTGQLLPGAYVQVHPKLPRKSHAVTILSNTLVFRTEGLGMGVVRNGRARLAPITIGRDYGATVEVVSRLMPADSVIINPSDSLIDGQTVRLRTVTRPEGTP